MADTATFAVTGATGFVGSALCRALRAACAGSRILAFGRNDGALQRLGQDCDVIPLTGDLASLPSYGAHLSGVTHFFHAGAKARFGNGAEYERDTHMTRVVVETLRRCAPGAKLVYVSSIAATDRHPREPLSRPLDEESDPCPQTDYGRSKLRSEHIVRSSGLSYVIARLAWVYGTGMREDSHLREFIRGVGRRALYTRVNWPGRVSLVHITDTVSALSFLGLNEAIRDATFVVAGPGPLALREVFSEIDRVYYGQAGRRASVPAGVVWLAAALRGILPIKVQVLFTDSLACSSARLLAAGFRFEVGLSAGLRLMRMADDRTLRGWSAEPARAGS